MGGTGHFVSEKGARKKKSAKSEIDWGGGGRRGK